jgi:hypothetical protein
MDFQSALLGTRQLVTKPFRLLSWSFELLRFNFRNAVRLNRAEPELLLPLRRRPNRLSMVGNRKGTGWGGGLQKPHEDHRSWAERTSEGEVLVRFFVPLQLAPLDEEGMLVIPARRFDRVGIGNGTLHQEDTNLFNWKLQMPCQLTLC